MLTQDPVPATRPQRDPAPLRTVLPYRHVPKRLRVPLAAAMFVFLVVFLWNWIYGMRPAPHWTLVHTKDAHCRTVVMENDAPQAAYSYAVVRMNRWTGWDRPTRAKVYSGESFVGFLDLGNGRLHDDSTGYDVDVTTIYRSNSSEAVTQRLLDDCGRR